MKKYFSFILIATISVCGSISFAKVNADEPCALQSEKVCMDKMQETHGKCEYSYDPSNYLSDTLYFFYNGQIRAGVGSWINGEIPGEQYEMEFDCNGVRYKVNAVLSTQDCSVKDFSIREVISQ